MGFLSKLFGKKNPWLSKISGEPRTRGEQSAGSTGGRSLIDGRQTWELADEKKHDIDYMKRCCDVELKTMEAAGLVPAPYFFERVAVLSRKAKNYSQEIHYCETYIRSVSEYYAVHGTKGIADVRKGPRYKAIVARLPKARELLAKSEKAT